MLFSMLLTTKYSAVAQNFLTTSPTTPAQFTAEQTSRLQNYAGSPTIEAKQSQIIQLNHLLQFQQEGVLKFTLPGSIDTLKYRAKTVEVNTNGDYIWYGLDEDGDAIVVRLVAGLSPNGPFVQTTKLITADRCGLTCWRSTPKSVVSDGVAKVIAAPNPAHQELLLTTFGLSGPTEFVFYDGQGRILERKKWEISGYEERLLPFQIGHLPEGMIRIRCHNGTFSQTLRIIHTH